MEKGLERYKCIKRVLAVILAYLSVLSMAHISSLHGHLEVFWGYVYFSYNIWSVLLFGATVYLCYRALGRKDIRLHVVGG